MDTSVSFAKWQPGEQTMAGLGVVFQYNLGSVHCYARLLISSRYETLIFVYNAADDGDVDHILHN